MNPIEHFIEDDLWALLYQRISYRNRLPGCLIWDRLYPAMRSGLRREDR